MKAKEFFKAGRLANGLSILGLAVIIPLCVSCDQTGDDLRELGLRVEALENKTLKFTDELEALKRIVTVMM